MTLVALLATEAVWLAPDIARAAGRFGDVRVQWVGLALVAEIISMVTFARLQRSMLTAGGVRVALRRAVAVTLVGNAISVTLPGGTRRRSFCSAPLSRSSAARAAGRRSCSGRRLRYCAG